MHVNKFDLTYDKKVINVTHNRYNLYSEWNTYYFNIASTVYKVGSQSNSYI